MMSKAEHEDRILPLVYLGEANLQYCQRIRDFITAKKKEMDWKKYTRFRNKEEVKYFVLIANNHFFEAVSMIHSLVHEGSRQEISFKNYLRKYPNENLAREIECIRKKYKEYKLDDLRNKVTDHKEINEGNPGVIGSILIDKKWVDYLSQIIKELIRVAYEYFPDSVSNNYLYDGNVLGEIMARVFGSRC